MSHDDLQLDLLPEFDFDDFGQQVEQTRARINARRAKSEAHLAEILPAQIDYGDAWHVLSARDFDDGDAWHVLSARDFDDWTPP